jgi:hypothetical protein
MTRKILIVCLILWSCLCYGQNYISYHKSVALAQHNIAEQNYELAINIFDTIFRRYDFVFPRDCFIAAEVASYCRKDSIAFAFLKKGVRYGIHLDAIKSNPHLNRLQINKELWEAFCNEYPTLRTEYNRELDWDLKCELINMFKEDQLLRDRHETWLNIKFHYKWNLYKKWFTHSQVCTQRIKQIIEIYGFPSYSITGTVNSSFDSHFDNFRISSNEALIILYHYDFAYIELKDILFKEVERGNISAKEFALLRDFSTRFYIFGVVKDSTYKDYQYFVRWFSNNKKLHLTKPSEIEKRKKEIESKIAIINADRSKIGLGTYEDQLKIKSIQDKFEIYYNQWYSKEQKEFKPYFDFFYYDL